MIEYLIAEQGRSVCRFGRIGGIGHNILKFNPGNRRISTDDFTIFNNLQFPEILPVFTLSREIFTDQHRSVASGIKQKPKRIFFSVLNKIRFKLRSALLEKYGLFDESFGFGGQFVVNGQDFLLESYSLFRLTPFYRRLFDATKIKG